LSPELAEELKGSRVRMTGDGELVNEFQYNHFYKEDNDD